LRRDTVLSWLALAVMAGVCGFLAFQQFRWTGEIAVAERERLRTERESALQRIREAFEGDLMRIRSLQPPGGLAASELPLHFRSRLLRHDPASPAEKLVARVYLAAPREGGLDLTVLDRMNTTPNAEWPPHLAALRERMSASLARGVRGPFAYDLPALIEMPRFGPPIPGVRSGWFPGPELDWAFAELDAGYLRAEYFPELLRKHLGGEADYEVRISLQDADLHRTGAAEPPDAAITMNTPGFGPRRGPPHGQRASPPPPDARGHWEFRIRHRTLPLDSIVSRARWRNLSLSLAMLGLLAAAAYALLRSTLESQRLARLQMNFAAGMSHEFRTPLTVIGTAAYNLQGRLASNPAQVERYAQLIRSEAEKLTAIVEQVLAFSSTRAGKAVRKREPVLVEDVIEDSLRSSTPFLARFRCQVEKDLAPNLPVVMGDSMALRNVFQNLLSNAAKYGSENGNWIGVKAAAVEVDGAPWVEIRVADRGPGIPKEEQPHIFDAFYRGKQAVQDQIHGTGLGLNLAKSIIEAHKGSISVESEPMRGAEFIVRLPAAPAEYQDEFTHSFD
jgi:signal transduction histidine kinase